MRVPVNPREPIWAMPKGQSFSVERLGLKPGAKAVTLRKQLTMAGKTEKLSRRQAMTRTGLWVGAALGGSSMAAPAGATDTPGLDLQKAGQRYRALLEAGDQIGVVPQLELWGFSKNLNRLGECACVAIETGHPKACVLVDIYHLYKGGSDYHGL